MVPGSLWYNPRMLHSRTVLVFGTFDGLHDGHRYFLREARTLGDKLAAAVAHDNVVQSLKGKPPRKPLPERLAGLRASGLVDEAVAGDTTLGSWNVVKRFKPDIIALGYDQTGLEQELRAYIKKENLPIRLVKIPVHKPEKHHTSLLP